MATRQKFGTQTTKGVVIYAFRNGDKHHDGEKIVLHPTKQKTFDQVLSLMTNTVKISTGSVRKVYTPTGKRLTQLEHFKDGGKYICCGAEKIDTERMPTVLQEWLARAKARQKASTDESSNTPDDSVIDEKKVEEPESEENDSTKQSEEKVFSVIPDAEKIIKVYRNADKHFEGKRIVVHSKKFKTLNQLLEEVTEQVGISSGPVKKLVHLEQNGEHTIVQSLDDIQTKTKYIACGAGPVNTEDIHPTYFTSGTSSAEVAPRPVKRTNVKFGTQTDKGVVIYVFRNGDKHDEGTRMVIHPTKFKTLDQVHSAMNSQVKIVTGQVRKVYNPVGAIVKSIDEFEEGAPYICAGAEKLNKELVSAEFRKRRQIWRQENEQ